MAPSGEPGEPGADDVLEAGAVVELEMLEEQDARNIIPISKAITRNNPRVFMYSPYEVKRIALHTLWNLTTAIIND